METPLQSSSVGQAPASINPAPSSNKALWAIVALLALVILGGGWYVYSAKNKGAIDRFPPNTIPQGDSQTIEFPWASYPASIELDPSKTYDTVIAARVVMGTNSRVRLVIAKTLDMGTDAQVSGSAYVFNFVNMGTNSRVETLYARADTATSTGLGASIARRVNMTHDNLVNAALAAIGSAPVGQNATTPPSTPVASTPKPTGTVSNPFVGAWSGRFTPNSPSRVIGCPGGQVGFTVAGNGNFEGPVTTDSGDIYYGGGTVTTAGTLKGTWHIGPGTAIFNGKLSGNSGSGSYADSSGCSGAFSVKR